MLAVIKDKSIIITVSETAQFELPNGKIILNGEPGWTDGEYSIGKIDSNDPYGYNSIMGKQSLIKYDYVSLDENNMVVHDFTFLKHVNKETLLKNFEKYGITEADILTAFKTHPDRNFAQKAAASWKMLQYFSSCPLMYGITDHLGLTREEMETLFEPRINERP